MKKAKERFNVILDLAILWVQNVSLEPGTGSCSALLNNPDPASPGIYQHLTTIKDELEDIQLEPTSGDADTTHAQTILKEAQAIELLNEDLARASCPQLY